jgi:predicted acyl esterase
MSISSGRFTILRQIRGAPGLHCETPHSSPIVSTSKGSEAIHKTVTEKNVAMRMRDGVTLKSDVYRPAASGKFWYFGIRADAESPKEPS